MGGQLLEKSSLGVHSPVHDLSSQASRIQGPWRTARDPKVEQVLIGTSDKDRAQCVVLTRVVQFYRPRSIMRRGGVAENWEVQPESIPDYLAVVGDSAHRFPGLPG